ncbi:hypothetical protein ACP70R_040591 [Stipagrostis hirtigluma subsp. patula]
MGNSLPLPCVCHEAATAGAAKKRRRKKAPASRNVLKAASPRHVVPVVVDMPAEDDDSDDEEAWPGYRVEPAGYGDDGGVLVKIVLKRKDAADLVARLDQRGAAERKARMEEINTDLGGGGGGVTVAMSPCRDAWRPRLASIPENS